MRKSKEIGNGKETERKPREIKEISVEGETENEKAD